jgi:hypothetical protein
MPNAKRSSRGRDRKLVAGGQTHEVSYTSRKAGVKGRAATSHIQTRKKPRQWLFFQMPHGPAERP